MASLGPQQLQPSQGIHDLGMLLGLETGTWYTLRNTGRPGRRAAPGAHGTISWIIVEDEPADLEGADFISPGESWEFQLDGTEKLWVSVDGSTTVTANPSA